MSVLSVAVSGSGDGSCRQLAGGGHIWQSKIEPMVWVVVGGGGHASGYPCGAVVEATGRLLGSARFRTDATGFWATGRLDGVVGSDQPGRGKGTRSYGAGLACHLIGADIDVVEVTVPTASYAARGASDYTDAEAAARAALNGEATAVPKSGDGLVEWIRMLTVGRRSAVTARTLAASQLHALVVGAPEPIKDQLRTRKRV